MRQQTLHAASHHGFTRHMAPRLALAVVLACPLGLTQASTHTPPTYTPATPTPSTEMSASISGWRSKVLDAAETAEARLGELLGRMIGAPEPETASPTPYGISLVPPDEPAQIGQHLVLLVHGLDEPGSIWDELIPELHAGGLAVARFDYPNDQSARASADLMINELRLLRARGITHIDIVAHSMGGLITLDVLTRARVDPLGPALPHDMPKVDRLITLGTPFGGSPWARLRAISEIRDHVERWITSDVRDPRSLLDWSKDGKGEAGLDLLPGSAYLDELLARPLPSGMPRMTAIIARLARGDALHQSPPDLTLLTESWLLRRVVGEEDLTVIVDSLRKAALEVGDGVVPESSARAFPVQDTVIVQSDHRSMIHRVMMVERVKRLIGGHSPVDTGVGAGGDTLPPAIPIIIERLLESGRDRDGPTAPE